MIDTLPVIAFALAFLALLTRWFTPLSTLWPVILFTSLIVALSADIINLTGLLISTILFSLVFYKLRHSLPTYAARIVVDIIIVSICFLLAIHIMPGFNNIMIVDNEIVKSGSIPYSLWFNYDKALAGIALIICYVDLSQLGKSLKPIPHWIGLGLLANLVLLFVPSLFLGLIAVNTEIPGFIGIWLVSNLFITALAEEAFFRGVIQQRLEKLLLSKNISHAGMVAVFVAGIVFGIAHLKGGMFFMVTGCVAGIVYGLIYLKTRRIEAAIFTHYLTNTIHILFFSYPMLAVG